MEGCFRSGFSTTLHSSGTETLALFSVRSVTLQGSTRDRNGDPGEAPGAHPHCSPTLQPHAAFSTAGSHGWSPASDLAGTRWTAARQMPEGWAGVIAPSTWDLRRLGLPRGRASVTAQEMYVNSLPDPPVSPEKSEIPIWIPRLQNLGASPV